jgi:hypothetical protein
MLCLWLEDIGGSDGASAFALFHRRGRGGQSDQCGRAAAAHSAAVVKSADSRSGVGDWRKAAGAYGARHCADRGRSFSITRGWRCCRSKRPEAARRAEQPQKPVFAVGFLAGQEVVWLPDALRILREEAPDVEFALSSQSSPELALALMRGKVDVAFLRRDTQTTGLAFKFLIKEPLIAVLPTGHRLAARKAIRPQEFARETYISRRRRR